LIGRRGLIAGLAAGTMLPSWPAIALPVPAQPSVHRRYIEGRYGQIHIRIAEPISGQICAPPLILFHQSPLSGRMFDKLLPYLAQNRRVIAVDTPGYGESDRPIKRPTLAEYGNAMLDALVENFGPVFDILGYHTGAAIAADIAARRQEVRRVIFIAMPFFGDTRRKSLLAQLAEEKSYADDGSHLVQLWTGTFGVKPEGQSVDDVARIVAEKQRVGLSGEWALLAAMELDLVPILDAISVPVLVVAPHDGLQTQSRAAAARINGAKLIEMPDLAYGLFDAVPKRIAEIVLPFLDAES
jgi:pimeloyl-ACP methyl ester carboxylesterase